MARTLTKMRSAHKVGPTDGSEIGFRSPSDRAHRLLGAADTGGMTPITMGTSLRYRQAWGFEERDTPPVGQAQNLGQMQNQPQWRGFAGDDSFSRGGGVQPAVFRTHGSNDFMQGMAEFFARGGQVGNGARPAGQMGQMGPMGQMGQGEAAAEPASYRPDNQAQRPSRRRRTQRRRTQKNAQSQRRQPRAAQTHRHGRLQPPAELARYGNGRIPAEALTSIGGGHRMYRPAAEAFNRMRADAQAQGVNIGVTDSYRSYDQQVDVARRKGIYGRGGLAAVPGRSNHGWGLSLDLRLDKKAQDWMRANGRRYGFVEDVPREPWHWTYRP